MMSARLRVPEGTFHMLSGGLVFYPSQVFIEGIFCSCPKAELLSLMIGDVLCCFNFQSGQGGISKNKVVRATVSAPSIARSLYQRSGQAVNKVNPPFDYRKAPRGFLPLPHSSPDDSKTWKKYDQGRPPHVERLVCHSAKGPGEFGGHPAQVSLNFQEDLGVENLHRGFTSFTGATGRDRIMFD
jgi:hypothetical protein